MQKYSKNEYEEIRAGIQLLSSGKQRKMNQKWSHLA